MLVCDNCCSFLLLTIMPFSNPGNDGILKGVGVSAFVELLAANIPVSFSLCRLILQYLIANHEDEERSSHGVYRVDVMNI